MGEEPQLDLAVIGRDDLVALRRDEGRADLAPGFRADRDVLQVRVGRGEAARRRGREREARCAPVRSRGACAAAACPCRSISASASWRHSRILRGKLMAGLRPVRRAASRGSPIGPTASSCAPGRPILPNRMSPICFGEPSENFSPAISWISSSSRASVWAKSPESREQDLPVDRDAAHLHAGDHVDQRPLQRLVDGRAVLGGEARLQHLPQAQGHVGVLGRVGGGAVDRDLVEAHACAARAGHLAEGDRRVAEMARARARPCRASPCRHRARRRSAWCRRRAHLDAVRA